MENNHESSLFEMEIDENGQQHLLTAAKWANFISFTGFIGCAVFLLLVLAFGDDIFQEISKSNVTGAGGIIVFLMLIVLGLMVLWMYFLYKAAQNLRKGVQEKNTNRIAEGFQAMQSFFIVSFIITILTILSTFSKLIN